MVNPEFRASGNASVWLPVGDNSAVIPPPFFVDQNTGKRHFRSACKARGVSDNHTPENAYLLIPEDAIHGHILKCSHPTCIRKGREFRYCAVCRQAVAKRNFHQRHDHGLIGYDKGRRPILPEENEVPPSILDSSKSSVSRSFAEVTTSSSDMPPPLKKRANTVSLNEKKKRLEASDHYEGRQTNDAIVETMPVVHSASLHDDDETLPYSSSHLCQAEMNWLKLFRERPRGGSLNNPDAKMSVWFLSVLGVAFAQETHDDVIVCDRPQVMDDIVEEKNILGVVGLDGLEIGDLDDTPLFREGQEFV